MNGWVIAWVMWGLGVAGLVAHLLYDNRYLTEGERVPLAGIIVMSLLWPLVVLVLVATLMRRDGERR